MSHIRTLHILNKAPSHPRTNQCLPALTDGDALLLTENGVLHLATEVAYKKNVTVYALAPDVQARGLGECSSEAFIIDFPAMVDLTAQAQNIISW